MAYSPQEKAEIVAQVAAKVAGSICCGTGDLDNTLRDELRVIENGLPCFGDGCLADFVPQYKLGAKRP